MERKRSFSCLEEFLLEASSSGKTPFESANEIGFLTGNGEEVLIVTLDGKFHFFDGSGNVSETPRTGFVLSGDMIPNRKDLTSVSIPDGTTEIWDYSFYECPTLERIEIPGSVKTIGDNAFVGCKGLIDANLGNGIERIGSFAFRNCQSLSRIHIPGSVTRIDCGAFSLCDGLESMTIPKGFEPLLEKIIWDGRRKWEEILKTVKFELT